LAKVLNVYLNSFDHFVKRELRCPAYLRYVDDFLLFTDDKATLARWRALVVERLAAWRLTIHPHAQPRPVGEGIPFLGFTVFPDRRRLKRRKVVNFGRKLRSMTAAYAARRITLAEVTASVQGWVNHARYGNTVGLRASLLGRNPIRPPRGIDADT